MSERILPDDSTLSARLRDALQPDSFDHTKITLGIVKTLRLRLGFIDTKIQLLFSTSTISSAQPELPKLLPLSDQTPTSPNDTIIPTLAQPVGQQTASVPSYQIPTLTSTAKHQQQTASIEAPDQAQALAATNLRRDSTSTNR